MRWRMLEEDFFMFSVEVEWLNLWIVREKHKRYIRSIFK